ncbi:MAG: hypothetical protein L6437_01940 [Kiritimatiellae bacterium]|nr:hypothetical protein [Kiritimatiellia bacterium]
MKLPAAASCVGIDLATEAENRLDFAIRFDRIALQDKSRLNHALRRDESVINYFYQGKFACQSMVRREKKMKFKWRSGYLQTGLSNISSKER